MKSVEELEKEIQAATMTTIDTYHLGRGNAILRIIAFILIEILKEIRSFKEKWWEVSFRQQDQQGKGRHK